MRAGEVPEAILEAVGGSLRRRWGAGGAIASVRRVGGGCINPAARLMIEEGSRYFLKWNEAPAPGLFAAEVDGLEALASRGALRTPAVFGVARDWLLLEFLEPAPPGPDFGRRLGAGLARLHEPGSGPAGWHRSNFIGPLPQENPWTDAWPAFWRNHRIAPQLRRARDEGRLEASAVRRFDALLPRIGDLLADRSEGPSLLHGDLWSGNVLAASGGEPALVDPAVYLGDREVDLAMAELFGGLPGDFLDAYHEALPLAPGYSEVRRGFYQLYPLLVHVNLFGGGYARQALARVSRLLAV